MKSIGAKFVIQIVVVITLIMTAVGILTVRYQKNKAIQFLEAKAARTYEQLGIGLCTPIWSMDTNQIKEVMRSYLRDQDILTIQVRNLIGNTIWYFGKDPATSAIVDLKQATDQFFRDSDVFTPQSAATLEILAEGEVVGTCDVMFSNQFITSQVHTTRVTVVLVLVCLITIETFVILVLVKRNISTPLKSTLHAAEQLAQGNFDIRLSGYANDEIGLLNTAFVKMSQQLKTNFHERDQLMNDLRANNDRLQIEIAERKKVEESLRTSEHQTLSALQETDHLFQQTQRLARELATLNELAQSLTTRLDVQGVVQEIYRGASTLLDTTNFSVRLYNQERDKLTAALEIRAGTIVGRDVSITQEERGFADYLIKTRQPLLFQDRVCERAAALEIYGIERFFEQPPMSWLGVPIMFGDRTIGIIMIWNETTSEAYNEHACDLLLVIGNHAGIALENARLFEQAQQEIAERKRAEAEIRTHQDRLEELVKERTEELRVANDDLIVEIRERQRAQEALQKLNLELEERVQERTAELAQAKADLELMLEMSTMHADQVQEDLLDRIDATLRESEQRFRVITKTIPIPILVSLRSDQTIVYANEPAIAFFNASTGTIVGHKITEFYPGMSWQHIEERLARQGAIRNYEMQGIGGGGAAFWGALYIQPLTFNEEPCLLSAVYDMTEHKQAEEALARERNLLRALIDSMPDFIYVKDTQSRFLIANPAAVRSMAATTLDEIIGKSDLDLFPHDLAEYFYKSEQAILASGQPLINQEEFAESLVTGAPIWLLTTKVPFRDSQGNIAGLVGISRDITELKHVQEELKTLNEELEQRVQERTIALHDANRALQQSLQTLQMAQDQLVQAEKMAALGTLVAGVAHEINTPVGIGVTAASFLKHKTQEIKTRYDDGEMKRSDLENYLTTADESAGMILQNLQRAAEQIQSFKQVAVDQVSSEERRFHLKAYIDDLLMSLHPKLKHTQHAVHVNCPEDLEIMSYPGAISQILTNLILNSLLHGFEGITQGQMFIDIFATDERLQLRYYDNGNGMTKEVCTHVFEPFYTTKRGQGSTGLGLHIVYNLVTQQLGGVIHCESTPGVGTTFIIQLPIQGNAFIDN